MSPGEINHVFNDQFSISTKNITDEGFVQADAIMSRVGIAVYKAGEFEDFKSFGASNADDDIRVYRPEETLFNDTTLKSFSNKPVTLGHPINGEVNSKNAKRLSVGSIGDNVTRSGDMMKSRITITDEDAINSMDAGTKFLSVGYQGKIIAEKGITDSGESYDAKLIFMKGNHVALTDSPRAGIQCKVLDEKQKKRVKMSKVKIKGIEVEINDSAYQAVTTLLDSYEEVAAQADSLQETINALNESIAALNEEKVNLTANLDALRSELEGMSNDETALNEKVDEKVELIDSVRQYIPNFKFSGKTEREIKEEVIKSFNDSFIGEGKSNEYIAARMDAAIENANKYRNGSSVISKINDSAIHGQQKISIHDIKQQRIQELNKRGNK